MPLSGETLRCATPQDRWPVMSAAGRSRYGAMPIDAGSDDLVTPCNDRLRAKSPERPVDGPALAVTLSGGGFRATLAALGVIRFLADADCCRGRSSCPRCRADPLPMECWPANGTNW
jgi:hypothetical protein